MMASVAVDLSLGEEIANLSDADRKLVLAGMSREQLLAIQYDWNVWARSKQKWPAGDWSTWMLMAGRGFGKTRTGAEWVRYQIEKCGKRRFALVGATAADARDIMVEGESGILAISPPWFKPIYKPSKRRLIWPNGAIATVYSSEKPDRLRGPSHDGAWADELAAWRNPDAFDMLLMTMRLGTAMARLCVTTTPKPVPHVKDLVAKAKKNDGSVVLTKGTTYENLANLSPRFKEEVLSKYQGTRLGRQEINAELLDDAPGSLWKRWMIDKYRIKDKLPCEMRKVIIGVDPEATSTEESAETGIIGAGEGEDGHGYTLGDFTMKGTPAQWGKQVVKAYHILKANKVVAEANNGGEMVQYVIQSIDRSVPVEIVYASRGKYTRAEPVAALSEQGKIHHFGYFPELEDQMCQWTPGEDSPDRMDAMVWAYTELFVTGLGGGARKLKGF